MTLACVRFLARRYTAPTDNLAVGIGGIADINGLVALANSVEIGPEPTYAASGTTGVGVILS